MRQKILIFFWNFLSCFCQQVTVTQKDKFVVVKVGEPIALKCEHSDRTGTYNMLWYQQISGKGLELIVLSTAVNDFTMEKKFTDSWRLERPDVESSTLRRNEATSEDSAVYFCASSCPGTFNTGSKQEFGQGTVVSVIEGKDVEHPKVSIYRSSKQEVEEHNFISLVCVARDFYPEHVKIKWLVNDVERVNLYEPVPQKTSDGSSYSTSKRLTLTRSEYFNPESKFECQAAFPNSPISRAEVRGEKDCSISKETYTIHINQGKISYIMILCKSGLYALVVLALLWRKKAIASSY